MKIIGNKGLANNSLGNSIKKILVKSSKSNEAFVNGCKMQLDENDIMQISLYDYEPIETELVKSTVKKSDITIDVGANIGYYTLLMAKIGAFVHSYEPEPNNFKLLSTNVHQNNFSKYVTLNNKAVSNFNGTSDFYLSELDLCSSLLKYKFVKTIQVLKNETQFTHYFFNFNFILLLINKTCAEK